MAVELLKLQTPGKKSLAFDADWMLKVGQRLNAIVLTSFDCEAVDFTITPIVGPDRIEFKITRKEVDTEPGDYDPSLGANGEDGSDGTDGGGSGGGGFGEITIDDVIDLKTVLDSKVKQSDFDDLKTRVDTLRTDVDTLRTDVDDLISRVEEIEAYESVSITLCIDGVNTPGTVLFKAS